MIAGTSEREFHAPVAGGEIVGWVRGIGPPALLLHGGPGISEYLAELAIELSGVMTVARYQQRGLPPSVTEGDRSVDGHVADAVAVLDALGWQRAWIIGHSWGGHLAMHLAVVRPERVTVLAALDALGALPDGGAAALGENVAQGLTDAQRVRLDEYSAREEAGEGTAEEWLEIFRMLWPYYFADPASAAPMPDFRMDLEGHLATWSSIAQHFEGGTLERGLPRLQMPALVLHGDASPIPYAEAERGAALIQGVRLRILPGVGHFAWLEQPGSVRREMEALLASA
ncbi:MAG: alpha/beta hydrolase [Chloroflexi bacterium]|nr:alpha/beta hydrolase [Chloroflexota bacterium]